jgi:hypothetical protein
MRERVTGRREVGLVPWICAPGGQCFVGPLMHAELKSLEAASVRYTEERRLGR